VRIFEFYLLEISERKSPLNFTNVDSSVSLVKINEEFSWWKLYKKVAYLGAQAFSVYFVTFALFPGVLISTKFDFMDNIESRESWFDISMLTIYAVIDTIGRYLANVWIPFNKNTVIWLTAHRIIHIPLSIFIELALPPKWLFQSDWFRILNISIFGFTQGYATALVMMLGPEQVKNTEKEKAGIIMNFHLMGGI
jgi:hypothetical protein